MVFTSLDNLKIEYKHNHLFKKLRESLYVREISGIIFIGSGIIFIDIESKDPRL